MTQLKKSKKEEWGGLSTTGVRKLYKCRGADKSLTRPGRKQATTTEDFDFRISYF
jgi:hypothetical protein